MHSVTPYRITSVDALRGFVMFMMIFVNSIADMGDTIPDWMVHYVPRHTGSGMTFVDLVFPAFIFIVGMSIPFSLGSRIQKGESVWSILLHVLIRALSLMLIGILMANKEPPWDNVQRMDAFWSFLLYVGCILSFCSIIVPPETIVAEVPIQETLFFDCALILLINIATSEPFLPL